MNTERLIGFLCIYTKFFVRFFMIFELWHSENDHCYSYFPRDENYQRNVDFDKRFYPDMKLVFTYDAKSYFEAMQAKNDFLGWGKYKPEPDWDDIFYND